MSVLNTRNFLVATCGAVLGCASAYAYGGANQLVALAGVVGAVAISAIYRAIPESGFKPFDLDITPYRYLGDIDNRSLLAHKALGNEDVCVYLRKMDLAEFELIKKEHEIVVKAYTSTTPWIKGLLGAAVSAATLGATIALGGVATTAKAIVGFSLTASGVAWAPTSGLLFWHHLYTKGEGLGDDRASRLRSKIDTLSSRISELNCRGGYSLEVEQLKKSTVHFKSSLRRYSNMTYTVTGMSSDHPYGPNSERWTTTTETFYKRR